MNKTRMLEGERMKPLTPQSMGRLGGLARAKKLSKAKRIEIATKGGQALAKKMRQKKERKP